MNRLDTIRINGVNYEIGGSGDSRVTVNYTQAEADAYNAELTGALEPDVELTSEQATAYNTVMGLSSGDEGYKEAGGTLTEAEANAYNATLTGAVSTSDTRAVSIQDYVDDKFEDVLGINAGGVAALKALTEDLDAATGILTAIGAKANSADLATVASSGSYNDLTDKPTIPSLTGYATEQWVGQLGYLTQHLDITGKADVATTLAGYGIADANINNGVITLGSETITPLTSHQDISGKADKLPMTGAGAATENNFMAIDANGNIKDSGKKPNDFQATLVVGTNLDNTPTANSNHPVTSGGVKTYVDTKNNELDTRVTNSLNTQDTTINTRMAAQDAAIAQYNGNDVIVGALPATGVANKIYRVPDDPTAGKYTDYMFNAGALATPVKTGGPYDFPGIDKMPIDDSDNVVESGGLYGYLEGWDKEDLTSSVTWTHGYAIDIDGKAVASANAGISNFIEVSPGDVYRVILHGTGYPVMGYTSNDENTAVVTAFPYAINNSSSYKACYVLEIPSGINYIRIGCLNRQGTPHDMDDFNLTHYSEISNMVTKNMTLKTMIETLDAYCNTVQAGSDNVNRFYMSWSNGVKFIIKRCTPGDRFTVKTSWASRRSVAFYTSDLTLIGDELKDTAYTGIVTAPANAAFMTCNIRPSNGDYCYKGSDPMSGLSIRVCSQADYDAMSSHDSKTIYIIT